MNCKEACVKIYSLADNELNTFNKKQVMKHLESCNECSEKYSQVMKVKNLISSEITIEDFEDLDINISLMDNRSEFNKIKHINKSKKSNSHWRYSFMKKKVIASTVAILLMAGAFIPVKGASLADSIMEWVENLTFSSEKTDFEITTDYDIESDVYHMLQEELEENLKSAKTNYGVNYSSLAEARSNISSDFQVPSYVPYNSKLTKIQHFERKSLSEILILSYGPNKELRTNSHFFTIVYHFTNTTFSKIKRDYSNTSKLLPATISEFDGYFVLRENTCDTQISLTLLMEKDNLDYIDIELNIPRINLTEKLLEGYKEELIKIAESILD